MIYTITINPALDLVINTPTFEPKVINRSNTWDITSNGKGINVSSILKTLNKESIALGFKAGFTGRYLEDSLRDLNISNYLVNTSGKTRINVFINDNKTEDEYKISNEGSKASLEEKHQLLNYIDKNITKNDLVIISGSYKGVVNKEFVIDLLDLIQRLGASFVFDVDDKYLFLKAIEMKPFLIKPSKEEFESFFNVKLGYLHEVKDTLKDLVSKGVQNTILSLGDKGAIFSNKDQMIYGKPPKGNVVNTSCAGDTMIGVFVAKHYVDKLPIKDSFAYSIAGGSSTTFVPSLSDLKDLEELKDQVIISDEF